MKSEQARQNWRELMDHSIAGAGPVVIERYNKPIAVVISWDNLAGDITDLIEVLEERAEPIDLDELKEWAGR